MPTFFSDSWKHSFQYSFCGGWRPLAETAVFIGFPATTLAMALPVETTSDCTTAAGVMQSETRTAESDADQMETSPLQAFTQSISPLF